MITEIIWGVIAAAFVVLVVFCVIALQKIGKTVKKTEKTLSEINHLLGEISEPTAEIVENISKLTADINKKAAGLDVLFRPLYCMKQKHEPSHGHDKVSNIIDFAAEGLRLFNKIKNEMK